MNDTVLIEESLKEELGTLDGDHFRLLVLVKEVAEPDLLMAFLQGLCKPYKLVAFFLYSDAIEMLDREDCSDLKACFIRMVDEGLKVFAANECLPSACPSWLYCCSMRDLPLLIQEATKVVTL